VHHGHQPAAHQHGTCGTNDVSVVPTHRLND
jgi:hypothetical protein